MCSECRGQGERINAFNYCKVCEGNKVVKNRKILEVRVEKGMKNGHKVIFSGEGDQEPGLLPGDIIVDLNIREKHAIFTRINNNLIMDMHIGLVEALCGFRKPIKTLDNRTIVISVNPGKIIKNGKTMCVVEEGMPQYKNPSKRGNLLIKFHVDLPTYISLEIIEKLEALLPSRSEVEIPDASEEVPLIDLDESQDPQI